MLPDNKNTGFYSGFLLRVSFIFEDILYLFSRPMKFAACLLFFLIPFGILAQDQIILRNGKPLTVKEIHLLSREIQCKKPDGDREKDTVILQSDVFVILYANGTRTLIAETGKQQQSGNSSINDSAFRFIRKGNKILLGSSSFSYATLLDPSAGGINQALSFKLGGGYCFSKRFALTGGIGLQNTKPFTSGTRDPADVEVYEFELLWRTYFNETVYLGMGYLFMASRDIKQLDYFVLMLGGSIPITRSIAFEPGVNLLLSGKGKSYTQLGLGFGFSMVF